MARSEPEVPFDLDADKFLICLRTARRGAAGGPSGMTSEHLFPILDNGQDSEALARVATLMARGEPDGGVRGIVVGDILRRLVARTMAKQVSSEVEKATAPFQYALSTKAGCECVAHIMQTLTDQDAEATVVSIDGVGAYDLISRRAMLEGLLRMEKGDQMRRAQHETSHKGREESKATPSCHSCSHLACTGHSQRSAEGCCRARRCSLSLMTCTSSVLHTGCSRSTEFWRRN